MSRIDVKVIKELDDQIVALEAAIKTAGEKGRENRKASMSTQHGVRSLVMVEKSMRMTGINRKCTTG